MSDGKLLLGLRRVRQVKQPIQKEPRSRADKKRELFEKMILDAIANNKQIIMIENIRDIETMNALIEPVNYVITDSLAASEIDEPSHAAEFIGGGIFTVTTVLRLTSGGGVSFSKKVKLIAEGKWLDNDENPLILFSHIKGPIRGRPYLLFAVGNPMLTSRGITEITQKLAQPAELNQSSCIFRVSLPEMNEAWFVIAFPLTIDELSEGPILLSEEFYDKINEVSKSEK